MEPKWLNRAEQYVRRFTIRNLMLIMVCGMAAVYITDVLLRSFFPNGITQHLIFNRNSILKGELWRLISFIFILPASGTVSALLTLYLYWMIGSVLTNQWGSARFCLFYYIGVFGSILGGFITGGTTNEFLNMSLFFAFALLYPNFKLMLFFILPIEIKYLALVNLLFFVFRFFQIGFSGKMAMLFSLANLALFFWTDAANMIRQYMRRRRFRKSIR